MTIAATQVPPTIIETNASDRVPVHTYIPANEGPSWRQTTHHSLPLHPLRLQRAASSQIRKSGTTVRLRILFGLSKGCKACPQAARARQHGTCSARICMQYTHVHMHTYACAQRTYMGRPRGRSAGVGPPFFFACLGNSHAWGMPELSASHAWGMPGACLGHAWGGLTPLCQWLLDLI